MPWGFEQESGSGDTLWRGKYPENWDGLFRPHLQAQGGYVKALPRF